MTPLDAPPLGAVPTGQAADVADLATKACQGERAAFERLIDRFQADIFRMVYYRTKSRMDAEDLTQEIFLQAYRSVHRLQDPERFRAWLYAIAANRVRDFLRRRRFQSLFVSTAENEPPDVPDRETHAEPDSLESLLQREFWSELHRLAAQLSRWEREVFFLRFIDQLSLREIAEVLKKSDSAVKTHLYRALQKFKENRELIALLQGESP